MLRSKPDVNEDVSKWSLEDGSHSIPKICKDYLITLFAHYKIKLVFQRDDYTLEDIAFYLESVPDAKQIESCKKMLPVEMHKKIERVEGKSIIDFTAETYKLIYSFLINKMQILFAQAQQDFRQPVDAEIRPMYQGLCIQYKSSSFKAVLDSFLKKAGFEIQIRNDRSRGITYSVVNTSSKNFDFGKFESYFSSLPDAKKSQAAAPSDAGDDKKPAGPAPRP